MESPRRSFTNTARPLVLRELLTPVGSATPVVYRYLCMVSRQATIARIWQAVKSGIQAPSRGLPLHLCRRAPIARNGRFQHAPGALYSIAVPPMAPLGG